MRIRWSDVAVNDLTSICDYIEQRDSAPAARHVALAIYEKVKGLEPYPRQGRPGRRPDTRELVVAGLPYLIVYRIREDVVEINRILHGAQKWP
jgi:addiction module RelE/StbE family toxin